MSESANGSTRGAFNYQAAETPSSLRRTGTVFTRRDLDGSDGETQGVRLESHELRVRDGRLGDATEHCTLDGGGFELLQRPLEHPSLDFFDHEQVVRDYYAECARIVEAATGGRAIAFDHNVRSVRGKKSQQRIRGGQTVQGPARVVHGDYTLTSAPQRLRDLTRPAGGNDTARGMTGLDAPLLDAAQVDELLASGGRYGIINVWRNIAETPVRVHPLALCDGRSVAPDDLVVFEIRYADRIGENYFAKHAERHRWFYFPEMTADEVLLIKQWDSAGRLAQSEGAIGDGADETAPSTFSLHSAFDDERTLADAPDRWSIEVRCAVLHL